MPETSTSVADPRAVTRDMFSASFGSICCCYASQSFDTVRVRMQTNPDHFAGVWSSTSSIFRKEGITAFWKGSVPTALGMMAENVVAFPLNEALKRAFPDDDKCRNSGNESPDLLKSFKLGAITGCCSAMVLLPSEVIKIKTQDATTSISSTNILKRMIRESGYKSLFVGLDAQLARDSAFYAFFFGGYQLNCHLFRTYVPSMPEKLNFFLSGGFAGMMGWALAMPFDVPKTMVQAKYDAKVVGSYFPQFVQLAQTQGILGLYSGLGPTLLRAFPANAALFLGVEMAKRSFDRYLWIEPMTTTLKVVS